MFPWHFDERTPQGFYPSEWQAVKAWDKEQSKRHGGNGD